MTAKVAAAAGGRTGDRCRGAATASSPGVKVPTWAGVATAGTSRPIGAGLAASTHRAVPADRTARADHPSVARSPPRRRLGVTGHARILVAGRPPRRSRQYDVMVPSIERHAPLGGSARQT
jgi:hypothetical protein